MNHKKTQPAMQKTAQEAAQLLLDSRLTQTAHRSAIRLPKPLRPQTFDQAWLTQQTLTAQRAQTLLNPVVGWKCGLPFGQALQNKVVAPIFKAGVQCQSPCTVELQNGACAFEPELGFTLKHPLPAGKTAYTQEQIMAAIGHANLVLELIENRYEPSTDNADNAHNAADLNAQPVSFYEQLADGLFHQGLWIGPRVPLDLAFNAGCIDFSLELKKSQSPNSIDTRTFSGQHPNLNPLAPLFWLVDFLNQQGIDLPAGHMIITGSYAGLLTCPPNQTLTLSYGTLGKIVVSFVEQESKRRV